MSNPYFDIRFTQERIPIDTAGESLKRGVLTVDVILPVTATPSAIIPFKGGRCRP